MRTTALLALTAAMIMTSCYYGAMQGAHTLGKDHYTVTAGGAFPAYFSAESRREAQETGEDRLTPYPSLDFAVGATGNVDVGISAFGYGVGPMVKIDVTRQSNPTACSAMLNVNYVIPAQVLMTRFSACIGRTFEGVLEAFAGADVGYGPDLLNIPEKDDGSHDWDAIENTVFYCLRAGCEYGLKTPGGGLSGNNYVPESIFFQFSVPMGISRRVVLVALGFTY